MVADVRVSKMPEVADVQSSSPENQLTTDSSPPESQLTTDSSPPENQLTTDSSPPESQLQAAFDVVERIANACDTPSEEEDVVSPPRVRDISDSDDYDTDLENEVEPVLASEREVGRTAYSAACERLQIAQSRSILTALSGRNLQLRYRNLGPAAVRALADGLRNNTTVEVVDLQENGLGAEGGIYFMHMLKYNNYIAEVNLSSNRLGSAGAVAVGDMLPVNAAITDLNLSDNQFSDEDAEAIAIGFENNDKVMFLDLSKNGFSELAGVNFGRMLATNNGIEHLDLSWNHLRRKGAVTLCNGIKRNYSLTTLDVAWNGFAYEGSLAIGEILKANTYLRELDVSHNGIGWQAARLIARGLSANDSLEELKIGHNPLTMTGCLDILQAVSGNASIVSLLDFDGIPVNSKMVYVAETIGKTRKFRLVHGGIVNSEDVLGRRLVMRWDPLKLLVQFLSDKAIRPVDLFRRLDKDNQQLVSRDHFIQGLKKVHAPLDEYETQKVLNRLYSSKKKISYPQLVEGFRIQLMKNREEEKKKREEDRKLAEEHKRIMRPQLPPIAESTSVRTPGGPRPATGSSQMSLSTVATGGSRRLSLRDAVLAATSLGSLPTSSPRVRPKRASEGALAVVPPLSLVDAKPRRRSVPTSDVTTPNLSASTSANMWPSASLVDMTAKLTPKEMILNPDSPTVLNKTKRKRKKKRKSVTPSKGTLLGKEITN